MKQAEGGGRGRSEEEGAGVAATPCSTGGAGTSAGAIATGDATLGRAASAALLPLLGDNNVITAVLTAPARQDNIVATGEINVITAVLTAPARQDNIVATGEIMQVTIRTIGNSRGVVLPKPLLAQVGLGDDDAAEMTVEDGAIVLRKAARPLRAGWAEAAMVLAAKGDDELVMGEFGNEADAELAW
jgi:antitoxin MazE